VPDGVAAGGERAIAVAWRGKETSGGIGFEEQKPLLEAVFARLPPESSVLLVDDRFYGTAALIRGCQEHGWHYRRRLRENLTLPHEGGEITTREAAAGLTSLRNAE